MDHLPLPVNKNLTKVRHLVTTKRLKKMQKLEQYRQVMTHYIPPHAILTENA